MSARKLWSGATFLVTGRGQRQLACAMVRMSVYQYLRENGEKKDKNVGHTLISGSTSLLDPSRRRLRQLGKANEHSVAEEQVRYRAWRLKVSERTSSEY
jgi:hypothetical protein